MLYNPHFSVKKDGWSTFLEFGNEIINYALGRDDIFLIIRPHPFLFETLVSEGLWSNEEVLQVKNRIKDSNCCMLDESVDYMQSFKVSDFLISDVSSFLLEYAQTNKPVIYLKKECSVNLNDDESFVNKLYVSRNVDELKQYLNKLLRGDDSGKAERLNMLPQYFTKSLHGNGNAIANYILSEVRYGSNVNYRTEGMKSCDLDSSEEYWKAALTSYLGTPEYYDLQETVLTEVYSKFEKVKSALDVGCSDGRYTELLFKVSEEVTAQDISPVLLEKCKENLKNYNVTFDNSNLVDSIICKSYDLVSCLGVTSTIIDNNFFFNFLTKLTSACNSNGLLITKESLSLNDEQLYSSNGYFGKYRNVNEYLNSFTCQGFEIQSQIELARDEDKSLVNKLFIFKKVGVSH